VAQDGATVRSMSTSDPRCLHAVRFYSDPAILCRIAGDFVADGLLHLGAGGLIVATPAHAFGILEQLADRGLDTAALQATGDLVVLSVDEAMAAFMVEGWPDQARFVSALGPVIERLSCRDERPHQRPVRIYGEVVDVLWQAGLARAATRLEMHWNTLARSYLFSLLCGYSADNTYEDGAVAEICNHHTHVLSASGEAAILT
jgi:hypothetical protein